MVVWGVPCDMAARGSEVFGVEDDVRFFQPAFDGGVVIVGKQFFLGNGAHLRVGKEGLKGDGAGVTSPS